MDMPFFNMLEGLSPWWWVAFGIALGAIEMATMSFFLIWPGLAALLMAVILIFAPGMPGEVQIAIYATLSVILTFAGRWLMHRYGDGGAPETTINQRSGQLVGRRGKILRYDGGEGLVEIDGVRWRARGATDLALTEGADVRVVAADGMTLEISTDRAPS